MCLLLLDKSYEKYVNNSYVMCIYSSLKQIFCKHSYMKELLMHDSLPDIDEILGHVWQAKRVKTSSSTRY